MNISLTECNDKKSFLSKRKRTHPHELIGIKLSLDDDLNISHNKNHIIPIEGDRVMLTFSLGELEGKFSEMFCVMRKDNDLFVIKTENNKCIIPRHMIRQGHIFVKLVLTSTSAGTEFRNGHLLVADGRENLHAFVNSDGHFIMSTDGDGYDNAYIRKGDRNQFIISDKDIESRVTTNWSKGILIGSWYDRRPEQI